MLFWLSETGKTWGFNGELENISLWLKINKLSLNIKKTHFVMFQKGKWTMSIPDITIDNQPIDKVEKTKFLCVVIDSKLSWKNHICLVAGKLSKSIGMIIKAREYLNRSALLTLYYSFVYPYYASAFRRRRHYVFGLSVRPSVRPSEAWNTVFWPVHGSVGPPDQP